MIKYTGGKINTKTATTLRYLRDAIKNCPEKKWDLIRITKEVSSEETKYYLDLFEKGRLNLETLEVC